MHFSSDLNVLRPSDPAKGNGVLLFNISNRGVTDLPGTFNRGNAGDGGIGDGLLMRDGYTMVFVGWEFDVPAPRLRIEAPAAILPAGTSADPLEHRNHGERARGGGVPHRRAIPRARWRFVTGPNGLPKIQLDGGFDPGRFYRVTYHASAPVVAGVGLAAIRDAAAA